MPNHGRPIPINARFDAIEQRLTAIETLLDPGAGTQGVRPHIEQACEVMRTAAEAAKSSMNEVIKRNADMFKAQRKQEDARIDAIEQAGRMAEKKAALVEDTVAQALGKFDEFRALEQTIVDLGEDGAAKMELATGRVDVLAGQLEGVATADELRRLGRQVDTLRRKIDGQSAIAQSGEVVTGQSAIAQSEGVASSSFGGSANGEVLTRKFHKLQTRVETLAMELRTLALNVARPGIADARHGIAQAPLTDSGAGDDPLREQVRRAQASAWLRRSRSSSVSSSRATSVERPSEGMPSPAQRGRPL